MPIVKFKYCLGWITYRMTESELSRCPQSQYAAKGIWTIQHPIPVTKIILNQISSGQISKKMSTSVFFFLNNREDEYFNVKFQWNYLPQATKL